MFPTHLTDRGRLFPFLPTRTELRRELAVLREHHSNSFSLNRKRPPFLRSDSTSEIRLSLISILRNTDVTSLWQLFLKENRRQRLSLRKRGIPNTYHS
jgi:hypothetical protein